MNHDDRNKFSNTSGEMSFRFWSSDNTIIVSLLLLCIGIVYYTPAIINKIAFLCLLVIAYRSKKDYFWIAFFFLLLNAPGKLFTGTIEGDLQRLPFYPISSGITLAFEELIIWMILFKSLRYKSNYFIFRKDFSLLIIYALVVILYSPFFGISVQSMIVAYRAVIPWLLLLVIPKILNTERDLIKLNRLLFPIVFMAIAAQLYSYIYGEYLVEFFKQGPQRVDARLLAVNEDSDQAARSASSMFIILYVFSQALFYYFSKYSPFSTKYSLLVMVLSAISVFLSASRGWIIAFTVIIILTIITFFRKETLGKIIRIGVFTSLIIFIMFKLFTPLKIQVENVGKRVVTVKRIVEGDYSAGGTLSRIEKRTPLVINKFKESPIIGWGFSDTYFRFHDFHVGHPSILLNVGIVGYAIINIIFIKIIFKIKYYSRLKPIRAAYGNGVIVFVFILIGIYLIHSMTVQIWGLHIKYSLGFLYSLLFTSTSIYIQKIK